MSLSTEAKRRLKVALTDETVGAEVAAAIDSGGNPVATVIAAFDGTTNLAALVPTAVDLTALAVTATTLSAAACAGAATPSATDVNAAIDAVAAEVKTALDLKADNADVETLAGEVEAAFLLKADNADVETLRTETEARLDAIETKVNALIAALKTAGLMAAA